MHVALECSLKAYILHKEGKQTIDLLRRVMRQEEYDELFFGSSGHQLQRLAGTAGLPRLLEAERRAPLLRGQTWANMCRAHRPYSLRYGCETIARNVAAAELRLGQEIVDTIDRSLWV